MKFDTIIFDLDGTLVDTIADLGNAVNHALSLRGYPLHSLEEYRRMVGHGIRNLNWQALPETVRDNDQILDEVLLDFLSFYSSHIDIYSTPYKGIHQLLLKLYSLGISLAVCSNKFQVGTEAIMAKFFPDVEFAAVLGNREGYPLKPDPAIIDEILARTSSSRERTVMVGDSNTDIRTAAGAGIHSIAVSWGFRPRAELCDAELIVDTVDELEDTLCLK